MSVYWCLIHLNPEVAKEFHALGYYFKSLNWASRPPGDLPFFSADLLVALTGFLLCLH